MIWFNEFELSNWAYRYCKKINDDPEVRKLITASKWACCYCRYIKDMPEVRKYITEKYWLNIYTEEKEYSKKIKFNMQRMQVIEGTRNIEWL